MYRKRGGRSVSFQEPRPEKVARRSLIKSKSLSPRKSDATVVRRSPRILGLLNNQSSSIIPDLRRSKRKLQADKPASTKRWKSGPHDSSSLDFGEENKAEEPFLSLGRETRTSSISGSSASEKRVDAASEHIAESKMDHTESTAVVIEMIKNGPDVEIELLGRADSHADVSGGRKSEETIGLDSIEPPACFAGTSSSEEEVELESNRVPLFLVGTSSNEKEVNLDSTEAIKNPSFLAGTSSSEDFIDVESREDSSVLADMSGSGSDSSGPSPVVADESTFLISPNVIRNLKSEFDLDEEESVVEEKNVTVMEVEAPVQLDSTTVRQASKTDSNDNKAYVFSHGSASEYRSQPAGSTSVDKNGKHGRRALHHGLEADDSVESIFLEDCASNLSSVGPGCSRDLKVWSPPMTVGLPQDCDRIHQYQRTTRIERFVRSENGEERHFEHESIRTIRIRLSAGEVIGSALLPAGGNPFDALFHDEGDNTIEKMTMEWHEAQLMGTRRSTQMRIRHNNDSGTSNDVFLLLSFIFVFFCLFVGRQLLNSLRYVPPF